MEEEDYILLGIAIASTLALVVSYGLWAGDGSANPPILGIERTNRMAAPQLGQHGVRW
jgi:hypothetical protein